MTTSTTPTCTVDEHGTRYWRLNGRLHRTDGPAVEKADGSKAWYLNGKRHRVDGPAIEEARGAKAWLLNDLLHRTDGPAIEYAEGYKAWYLDGEEVDAIVHFLRIGELLVDKS